MKLTHKQKISILLASTALLTIIIQFSDSKIQEHNEELSSLQFKMNNRVLSLVKSQADVNLYSIYDVFNKTIDIDIDEMSESFPQEIINLIEQFENGDITNKELIQEIKDYYYTDVTNTYFMYNNIKDEYISKKNSGTFYQPIKSLLIIIQIILIFYIIYLHIITHDEDSPENNENYKKEK